VAHQEPTKAFLKLSPEIAMLSAPFRCTHPRPPIPPFLLKQNLAPKSLQEVTSQDESFMQDLSSYILEKVNLYWGNFIVAKNIHPVVWYPLASLHNKHCED